MSALIDEILEDANWRVAELSHLRSLPVKHGSNMALKNVIIRYSVPAIYSIWEGFVRSTFTCYSEYLNKVPLTRQNISLNLLTLQVDSVCNFHDPRQNFDTKKRLVNALDQLFIDRITLTANVPTEANVNYKVLCNVMGKYCIDELDDKFETGLDRLLFFRNKIAHGENAIRVTMTDVEGFINLVLDLMLEVILKIDDCYTKRTFLK